MDLFTITSIIITLCAVFGFVNVRFLKLPNTIGLMVITIAFTLLVSASALFDDRILNAARHLIQQVDFNEVVLDVMLGFLLFAGAMHTNFDQLKVQRWPVLMFSTLGVMISTFLVGTASFVAFNTLGLNVRFLHCLLFGALISPTDPIAVLGILKRAQVPKKLETKIVGESLFNDGVGVVVFLTLFSLAAGGRHSNEVPQPRESSTANMTANSEIADPELADEEKTETDHQTAEPATGAGSVGRGGLGEQIRSIVTLFGIEVLGGIVLGLVLGYLTYLSLRSIDDYEIEVMITLACVMGGYSLASFLHLSAPLAMVVAGLMVGNDTVRGTAMSTQTAMYVDRFWELVDILLNAILFVLIGLEILILDYRPIFVYATLIAIVIVLVSRYMSLLVPVRFFAKRLDFVPYTALIMTWGGLRGGISIALALQLTDAMNRELFLTATYGVVIFSIIVQGLTVGPLARRMIGAESICDADAEQSVSTAI